MWDFDSSYADNGSSIRYAAGFAELIGFAPPCEAEPQTSTPPAGSCFGESDIHRCLCESYWNACMHEGSPAWLSGLCTYIRSAQKTHIDIDVAIGRLFRDRGPSFFRAGESVMERG
jgi:hypothetical protein